MDFTIILEYTFSQFQDKNISLTVRKKIYGHVNMDAYCVCRDIEYLESLEGTQKARVALGCSSSYSYASFVLNISTC